MDGEPVAIYPARGAGLGALSLVRNGASLVAGALKPHAKTDRSLPAGDGRTVLVIPAFLAGDWATARLRQFLSALGYRVETAGIAFNLGPTTQLLAQLDEALLRAAQDGPIALVGQSLGGILARDLARRHQARVRRLITLCSPIRVPITTPLAPAARLLVRYYDRDWLARRHVIAGPLGVPVTALYSKEDGVVDWRECLQDNHPHCENVRVTGAHATIGSSPSALAAIARSLGTN
ncbi:MAG TPA: alpha/beta fold hydrolase [Rhizomicrobium sp.]|nr:alpha/beta fold hydrolase [Rhizomicrobium sp.]